MGNYRNISWIEGEDCCRWKGMITNEINEIGEIYFEEDGICLIGSTLYVTLNKSYETAIEVNSPFYDIKDYNEIKDKLPLIKEFIEDLNDYYDQSEEIQDTRSFKTFEESIQNYSIT